MKTKLTSINRYTTKKDGTALVTKDGRPYTSVRIKTEEHGDKQLSGFESAETKNWVVGSEVDIEVEPKGEYLNFKVPKAIDKVDEKLELILNKLVGFQIQLATILAHVKPMEKKPPRLDEGETGAEEYPENDEEIPF